MQQWNDLFECGFGFSMLTDYNITTDAKHFASVRCAVLYVNATRSSPRRNRISALLDVFALFLLCMEWNGRFFCQHWGGTCQQRSEYNQLLIQPNRLNIENVALNFWPFLLRWFIQLKTVWYYCLCVFIKLFLVMILRINWK